MHLLKYQAGYYVIKWARQKMTGAGPAHRKQILVAVARRFVVEWWKVTTGQTSLEALGVTCAKT